MGSFDFQGQGALGVDDKVVPTECIRQVVGRWTGVGAQSGGVGVSVTAAGGGALWQPVAMTSTPPPTPAAPRRNAWRCRGEETEFGTVDLLMLTAGSPNRSR